MDHGNAQCMATYQTCSNRVWPESYYYQYTRHVEKETLFKQTRLSIKDYIEQSEESVLHLALPYSFEHFTEQLLTIHVKNTIC